MWSTIFRARAQISMFTQKIDLNGERSDQTQFYISQHEVISFASNGKQKRVDTYTLHIICEPGKRSAGEVDKYTCKKFSVKMDSEPETTIPSLANWSYDFNPKSLTSEGLDTEGLMLGIPHDIFENLIDNKGATLSIEAQYQVYSAFIYFHSWCNMLAEQGAIGLKNIGDKIVNDKSTLEHPINLGSKFLEGSKFIHGIETLEYKGLGIIDGVLCTILSVDERGGEYVMHMKPMHILQVKKVGATRFSGDIYINMTTLWVKKVIATIMNITQTTMFGIPVDTTVPVTTLTIKSVTKNEFDQV
jgi:hypothetical protein